VVIDKQRMNGDGKYNTLSCGAAAGLTGPACSYLQHGHKFQLQISQQGNTLERGYDTVV